MMHVWIWVYACMYTRTYVNYQYFYIYLSGIHLNFDIKALIVYPCITKIYMPKFYPAQNVLTFFIRVTVKERVSYDSFLGSYVQKGEPPSPSSNLYYIIVKHTNHQNVISNLENVISNLENVI